MALHRLQVDDFYDESFKLLAIHCRLEDYRLAYLLNKNLNLNLKRKDEDLDFELGFQMLSQVLLTKAWWLRNIVSPVRFEFPTLK